MGKPPTHIPNMDPSGSIFRSAHSICSFHSRMDDSDILCVNGTHVHDVLSRGCEDVFLVYELFLTSLLVTHLCCVHEK